MILDIDQIKKIILTNPNKALVSQARTYSKDLRSHIYGENIEAKLQTIDGLESDSLRKLRVKYAKSNKDLFSRLARPLDKIFSARGGSVYYNMNDSADKRASIIANNVRDGLSCKKWNESFWMPHYLDDPGGCIFIEINAANDAYPTYKSSSCIYDYLPKGTMFEYIVFTVSKEEKEAAGIDKDLTVYRVVDDMFDYYIKHDGEQVTQIPEYTFMNPFMHVPAIMNSDIVNPNMTGAYLSLFDAIIDLANDFLVDGSIKKTHKLKHGFPKYWEYADSCNDCNGTGFIQSDECKTCKGSGKSAMTRVSDIKLLSHPESKDDPTIAPNVAGYVTPPKDFYDMANTDLAALEDAMVFCLWGTHRKESPASTGNTNNNQPITATQAFIDVQPVNDRLISIAETAENRHKFIIDHIIRIKISASYGGASINYGRRFLIESPDVIWDRYNNARESGASVTVLDDLLIEFIETKYAGDPIRRDMKMKLMAIEPFVHFTPTEAQTFIKLQIDYVKKLYFGKWVNTLRNNELLLKTEQELDAMLELYAADILTKIKVDVAEEAKLQQQANTPAAAA